MDLIYEIKDFKFPLTITNDLIITLLYKKENNGPPEHMYM